MVDVVARTSPVDGAQSYVEWGAVIAGVVAALASSLVLLNFGAAVGLSSVSPWTTTTTGLKAVGVGAAFWFLLVSLWSFALGGYLAGRMRHRWAGATQNEMEFRDSAHGLLVWSLAVLVGAVMVTSGVSSVAKGLGSATSLVATSEPITASTDMLLRTDKATQPGGGSVDVRSEISRLLARDAQAGGVSSGDKTYLAQVVSARTGLSQADAEKRVDETVDALKTGADRARRIAVIVGFLTASILLIGAAIAWWAAGVGGAHRESGTIWQGFAKIERFR
jgi:hypothetical protein